MQVHITHKSSNKKTGPIPVTTTESKSCPSTCPFIDKGCYAKSGPLALHWRKVSSGERGVNWQEFCNYIQSLPDGQLWRHNQAGDLPHLFGDIDHDLAAHLAVANTNKRGYTYTHHVLNDHNVEIIKRLNRQGFTVNASTESLQSADAAIDKGLPAVVVIPSDQPVPKCTPNGHRVKLCPAQATDTDCATCKLCSVADRKCVIAFQAHGTAKKTVNNIVG